MVISTVTHHCPKCREQDTTEFSTSSKIIVTSLLPRVRGDGKHVRAEMLDNYRKTSKNSRQLHKRTHSVGDNMHIIFANPSQRKYSCRV